MLKPTSQCVGTCLLTDYINKMMVNRLAAWHSGVRQPASVSNARFTSFSDESPSVLPQQTQEMNQTSEGTPVAR